MGPEYRWQANVDLWVPLGLPADEYGPQNRFNESYDAVVRLKAGVKFEQANAFAQVLSDRVLNGSDRAAGYANDSAWGMFIVPLADYIAVNTKRRMLDLLVAVGFVLLLASLNLAGL